MKRSNVAEALRLEKHMQQLENCIRQWEIATKMSSSVSITVVGDTGWKSAQMHDDFPFEVIRQINLAKYREDLDLANFQLKELN